MSWESCNTYHSTQKNKGFSNMYLLLLCDHWGLIYTKSGYTLENPKWAERVVVLAIRRRKIRAFQICIHFYCAIIGVSFTELKMIKAFQWIPLSKIINTLIRTQTYRDLVHLDSSGPPKCFVPTPGPTSEYQTSVHGVYTHVHPCTLPNPLSFLMEIITCHASNKCPA